MGGQSVCHDYDCSTVFELAEENSEVLVDNERLYY